MGQRITSVRRSGDKEWADYSDPMKSEHRQSMRRSRILERILVNGGGILLCGLKGLWQVGGTGPYFLKESRHDLRADRGRPGASRSRSRIHDLRRSHGSHLAVIGTSLQTIGQARVATFPATVLRINCLRRLNSSMQTPCRRILLILKASQPFGEGQPGWCDPQGFLARVF
jgi:hypothetical protein